MVLGNEVQIYFKLLYSLSNFSEHPEFGVHQSHSHLYIICCCFSVCKSCQTLRDSMNCSTPGSSVLHHLPGVCSNSCPVSWWYSLTISFSATPFSFCLKFFSASRSFPMSQLFTSGSQSTGPSASASVLPVNIQG